VSNRELAEHWLAEAMDRDNPGAYYECVSTAAAYALLAIVDALAVNATANTKQISDHAKGGIATDGSHHKQWFLERIAELVVPPDELEEFRAAVVWEEGIAP